MSPGFPMTELYADMAADGSGWRGEVQGHPSPVTWLVARQRSERLVELELIWAPREDCAPIPVGDGALQRDEAGWRGMVGEFAGTWRLRGELPGRLLLWERS